MRVRMATLPWLLPLCAVGLAASAADDAQARCLDAADEGDAREVVAERRRLQRRDLTALRRDQGLAQRHIYLEIEAEVQICLSQLLDLAARCAPRATALVFAWARVGTSRQCLLDVLASSMPPRLMLLPPLQSSPTADAYFC